MHSSETRTIFPNFRAIDIYNALLTRLYMNRVKILLPGVWYCSGAEDMPVEVHFALKTQHFGGMNLLNGCRHKGDSSCDV